MSIQKHCVYYRDDENKIYYYDNSNHRKYVNNTFYDKVTEELYYFDENGERHVIDIDIDGYALSADVDTRIENLSSWANETFLTGVDLSDYALSADVDTRLEDTSAWANETFLTGVDLSDYALSADVDSRLEDTSAWANETFLTGVDLSDYALSADVDTRLEDTSAWANDTFVTSADLEDDKQYSMTNSGWQEVEIPENTDSWKHQSEEHGCIPEENSIYIGSENISVLTAVGDEDPSGKFGNFINIGSANTAFAGGINIGDENVILSGDTTIANINIGKQNKSKFGILIGQRNESSGFNYLLGDDNKGHYNGSYVIGSYNNMKNDGSFVIGSSNTWVDKRNGDVVVGIRNTIVGSSTVNLFGNDNTGIMGGGSTVVGNGITADDIHSSLVLAQQQKITAKEGSIVIATPRPEKKNGSLTATMTADTEGVILGGYADLDMSEGLPVSAYGLLAHSAGMIVGEGLYASAENNAMVVGNQSYAKNGAWTFGTNGYASDNSMVLNWETMRIPSAMSVRVYDKDNDRYITETVNPAEVINFSETTGGLFNTSAIDGSLSIGVNNSANCGSVIISTIPGDRSYIAISGIKENGVTKYFVNPAYGNSADGSSIILSTNAKGINYVKGQSIAVGLDGLSADTKSIAIGIHSITASGSSIAIGNAVSARNEGYAIGKNQFADGSSLAIGVNDYHDTNKAGGHSVAIGTNNAVTSDSVGIGNSNTADGRGFTFGYSNSAIYDAFVIGKYNNAKSYTNVFGMSNTASVQDTSIFGNRNSVSQYDSGISPNLTIVGDDNRVYARYYYNSKSKNIDVNIFGDENQIDTSISADMRLFGIMLGDRNKFTISAEKDPGGFNILLGTMNDGIYEAINIGTENNTNGHSVALGWQNKTTQEDMSHALLFGYANSANNTVQAITGKNVTITNYVHYTDAEINNARNAMTAAKAVIDQYTNTYSIWYTNSAGSQYNAQIKLVDYYYDSGYILGMEIVYPLVAGSTYESWSSASIGSKNYFVDESYKSQFKEWHNYQQISDTFYSKVRYVSQSTMNTIKNQLASFWTQDKLNEYNAYLQANTNYTNMVATNNTYAAETKTLSTQTNSLLVGTNNSAAHYNSYLFGSLNQSLTIPNMWADDGFVFAFGLNNTVVRNYDMAIGYGSVASGGENIVIGAYPYELPNRKATSIGFKNFNIRSYVNGVGNIGIDSNIPLNFTANIGETSQQFYNTNNTYKRTKINNITYFSGPSLDPGNRIRINNNVILNTEIPNLVTDNFNDNTVYNSRLNLSAREFAQNFINDSNCNITGRCFENIIFNAASVNYTNVSASDRTMSFNFIYDAAVTANISGDSFCENILLPRSTVNVTSRLFVTNFIFDTNVTEDSISGGIYGGNIVGNVAYHSNINATYGCINNMLFGSRVNNTSAVFSFTDESNRQRDTADLNYAVRVYNFGDNYVYQGFDNFILGLQNSASYVSNSFIRGRRNNIKAYTASNTTSPTNYENYNNMFEELLVYGNENIITGWQTTAYNVNCDRIIGNKNKICEPIRLINNTLIGNDNYFGYVTTGGIESTATVCDLYKNYKGSYGPLTGDPKYFTSAKNIYDCYVNGAHNIIGSYINGAYVLGNNNLVYTKNIPAKDDASFCDNIKIFGNFNLSRGGSNQFAAGMGNELSGHFAMAVGDTLKSYDSQVIVGKFNAPVDAAVRDSITYNYETSSVEVLEQSGVLFAVGNGTYDVTLGYTGHDYYGRPYTGYVDKNNNPVAENALMDERLFTRSNAMIVSADGTVSAKRFISEEPALEISGSEYINVSADPVTNVTTISVTTDLANMLTELSGVLSAKPATGKYMLGTDNGVLTWVPVTIS